MKIVKKLGSLDKGSLAGWAQQLCTASSALLLLPVFVRCLGQAQSGLWLTFQTVVGVAGLADFGISYVAARQAAYALGRQQGRGFSGACDIDGAIIGTEGVRETLRLARIANVISCSFGALVLFVSLRFARFDDSAGLSPSEVSCVVGLLGGTVLIRLWGRPFASILDGTGSLHLTRLIGAGQQVFMSVGAALIVLYGGGLVVVGCWAVVTSVVEYVMFRIIYRKRIGLVPKLGFNVGDFGGLLKLVKVAYPLGLVSVGGYLVNSIQLPFIAAALGPEKVAPYYVAQRIGQFANMTILQLVLPKLPEFTRLLGMGNRSAAAVLFRRSAIQVSILSIFGALVFCVMLPTVSLHYFKVQPLPPLAIVIMSFDLLLLNSTVVLGHYVLASGQNPFWRWTLVAGIINFTILYFSLASVGIVAIPVATVLAGVATTYWASIYHGRKLWVRLNEGIV